MPRTKEQAPVKAGGTKHTPSNTTIHIPSLKTKAHGCQLDGQLIVVNNHYVAWILGGRRCPAKLANCVNRPSAGKVRLLQAIRMIRVFSLF